MENIEIEVKTGGAYGDHIFISCDIPFELEIAEVDYFGQFQTGHSFDHNDYGYPTNSVAVYDDDEILTALDCCCDYGEFKDEYPEISEEEYNICYSALAELRNSAQAEVDEILKEEKDKLAKDKHVYVAVTEREQVEINENVYELRQCSPEYSCRFDDNIAADVFIEEQQTTLNIAYKITATIGAENHNSDLSNF